jgi:hypothetical protein
MLRYAYWVQHSTMQVRSKTYTYPLGLPMPDSNRPVSYCTVPPKEMMLSR